MKKLDRGDSDQLFIVYTDRLGKLEVSGKAIRKIKSKLRSGIDLFYLSEIEFIQGKAHKTLTDAILINNFKNIRKDLRRLSVANKVSEVLNDLVRGQEPDEKIWRLLIWTLGKINTVKSIEEARQKIYYYFFWNLISVLGYKPEFYDCSFCRKKIIPQDMRFSIREGGLICGRCFRSEKTAKTINSDTVKIIRIILKRNWKTLEKLKISVENLNSVKAVSDCYLFKVLERAH